MSFGEACRQARRNIAPERRRAIARAAGLARAAKAGTDGMRAIGAKGNSGFLAKVTPERRREIGRKGGIAASLQRRDRRDLMDSIDTARAAGAGNG